MRRALTLVLFTFLIAAPVAAEQKVDLNKAGKAELVSLGLTESQAQQVISHRQKTGPLLQVDELLAVPQMRREVVEKIRSRVTVGDE